jgi:hypothetical protein
MDHWAFIPFGGTLFFKIHTGQIGSIFYWAHGFQYM